MTTEHTDQPWRRGFWSLIVTQFQGAFNDNALKYLVIFLIIGTNLTLSWPVDHLGWRLQMNTNLSTTNWLDVAGAGTTNQISTQPANANAFFRLVYP